MKFIPAVVLALLALSASAQAATTSAPKPKAAAAAKASHVALPTNVRPERYDITIRPNAAKLS
ncbi:MAG: hypothetical protein ACXWKO_08870, partial [Phenylobacterium sp.]